MMDQLIIQAVEEAFHVGLPLDAGAVLIIELEGLEAGLTTYADEVTQTVNAAGATRVRLARDEAERALLWKARKRAFGRSAASRRIMRLRTASCRAPACRRFCE